MRDNKGINMITLSVAVIILVIVTSMLVYSASDGIKIKNLNNMYNDIEQLRDKANSYYIKYGTFPVLDRIGSSSNDDMEEKVFFAKETIEELEGIALNPNDSGNYYVLDLQALDVVTLNYGREYDTVRTAVQNKKIVDIAGLKGDIYIINMESGMIYYPRGIDVEGKKYYTIASKVYSEIDLKTIPISTAEELSRIGKDAAYPLTGIYSLQNNIDLSSICSESSGVSWTPIGEYSQEAAPEEKRLFSGVFLGNGYEIQNLYINDKESSGYSIGLFGAVGKCLIKDLTVTGNVTCQKPNRIGGIIGQVVKDDNGESIITNCCNKATVTCQGTPNSAGGIIGEIYQGSLNIKNCNNLGNVSGSGNAGGIIGYINGIVKMNKCYNKGEITNSIGLCAGGLIGRDDNNANIVSINNSYNDGIVTGQNNQMYLGGIIGQGRGEITINNSYNNGNITNNSTSTGSNICTGGIIGTKKDDNDNPKQMKIINTYNTGEITGGGNVGGIVGISSNNSIIQKCYNIKKIQGTSNNIGGIAGQNYGEVSSCYNEGEVNNTNGSNIGGIVGYMNSNNVANVQDCYNLTSVKGKDFVGGIVGKIDSGMAQNCYNIGTIEGTTNVGSVIGSIGATGEISNCYYLNTLTTNLYGAKVDGATIDNASSSKSKDEMTAQAFVNVLNSNTSEPNDSELTPKWKEDSSTINGGYPILEWQ